MGTDQSITSKDVNDRPTDCALPRASTLSMPFTVLTRLNEHVQRGHDLLVTLRLEGSHGCQMKEKKPPPPKKKDIFVADQYLKPWLLICVIRILIFLFSILSLIVNAF